MNITGEPLNALYTLLPIILYKHLNATPLEVSLFITLRPLFACFSFYWSSHLLYYKNKLVSNLIGAWTLSRLPFIFLFFFPTFWTLFLAATVYQLFSKAGIPAWIEILNRNIPKEPREHLFTIYNAIAVLEGVALSFVIGKMLDANSEQWGVLFSVGALLGLCSIFFIRKIQIPLDNTVSPPLPNNRILFPWKEGFRLMRTRPDFARFQWGFMAGGGALMLMAPALNMFYVKQLSVSYSAMTFARFACMGIGVALSSLAWKKGLKRFPINLLVGIVLLGFCCFPLTLLAAQEYKVFLYIAFFIYGIAQAGSQIIWTLSGTLFAKEGNSAPFTNVNILMLGLRGCVLPLLGGVLCELTGPVPILVLGAGIMVFGLFYMLRNRRSEKSAY
jgi:MFS family permease